VGRQSFIVIALVCFSLTAAVNAFGQGQTAPRFHPRVHSRGPMMMNPGRERFNQLSPDERQAFRRNAERWLKMNPEQQKALREREQIHRAQMKVEAEAAMRQLGLRLEPGAQGQFEARYMQERRRMERQLRQEAEAKRQQQLPQLNERLKSEFQARPGNGANNSGSPVVSPSSSAKP
jgi:hypothetical protein